MFYHMFDKRKVFLNVLSFKYLHALLVIVHSHSPHLILLFLEFNFCPQLALLFLNMVVNQSCTGLVVHGI